MKFSIKDLFSKCDLIPMKPQIWPNPQENADLVTFTREFLNGKLHFLCTVYHVYGVS